MSKAITFKPLDAEPVSMKGAIIVIVRLLVSATSAALEKASHPATNPCPEPFATAYMVEMSW